MEMEVTTVSGGGGGVDWQTCQPVYHPWPAGRLEESCREKEKQRKSGPVWQLCRGQSLFWTLELYAADNFNDSIHMNFQVTWKKNPTGG